MMEVTEQWIGKSAGPRVFREARDLLKAGKLVEVARKGEDGLIFQGLIGSGKRPLRVVVKVLGPHEIRNHCTCTMARRTGALCEHATALMLAGIGVLARPAKTENVSSQKNASDKKKATPQVPAIPLEVRLSPKFPNEGERSVHLKGVEDQTDEADQTLTDWLVGNVGLGGAALLSLPEDKVSGFYRSLSDHRRVFRGKKPMEVRMGRLKPVLEIEIDGETGETAWMRMVGDGLMVLGKSLAEWDEDAGRLMIDASDASSAPEPGEWQEMTTQSLIRMLPALGEMYQLPEDLGGIEIKEAVPQIVLEIAGSTRALQAVLTAVYPNGVKVEIGAQKSSDNALFPIMDEEYYGRWWVRNSDAEMTAKAKMRRAGFTILDGGGVMLLRGEDEVLDFLTVRLPELKKVWQVKTEEKLGRVASRVHRIIPKISVREYEGHQDRESGGRGFAGSGEDWLSCEVAWQCGNQTLSGEEVRKLLMSGSRSLTLPRGGKAVISQFDADVMDGFMLDTDPRQEAGMYRFPAQQSAYLRQLKNYYSDEVEEKENEFPVPDLPSHLDSIVRDYQRTGVEWLYRRMKHGGAALLADDMGLGKTLQALACLQLWKKNAAEEGEEEARRGPALIVCPATLLGNWRDEAKKFVPDLSVLVMHGAKRSKEFSKMGSVDVLITSYALLDRDLERYQELPLSMLILDEASAIRNPDTLAAKAARSLDVPARIAITGTPVENGVRDLWSIFQFLMPGYLGGREDFRLRYEVPCQAEIPDLAAMQRLRWRTAPFVLRRTKSEVAKDLPPKLESVVWCEPSPLQKDQYQSILRHGVEKVEALRQQSGPEAGRMQMLTVLLRLRQSCCDLRLLGDALKDKSLAEVSSKLLRLMELLEEARRGGHRVLVFSQFTSMLSLIRDELDREDVDYCYLDGATRDRSAVVKNFQRPDGPPVFLISLKAGGYGLTLTAADTVVLFDPWWNPAVEAQAADRIHRIGQTKPSTIYKLITRGTVEEKILRLQERKRNVISAAMGEMSDDVAPMMSGLTGDEMRELLE